MNIQIQYPKGIDHDSGYGQAFRMAVLHGLCFLANNGNRDRDINHANAIGYWCGRVSGIQQMVRYKYFKDFQGSVLEEIKRIEELLKR